MLLQGADAGVGSRCMVHFGINFCCVQGQVTYGDGSACRGGGPVTTCCTSMNEAVRCTAMDDDSHCFAIPLFANRRAICAFYGNGGAHRCVYSGPPAEGCHAGRCCPCGFPYLWGDKSACTSGFPPTARQRFFDSLLFTAVGLDFHS